MSMDLNFWKYKKDTAHDHSTVYQTACCDGEVMEVLEVLPIDEILKKVADSFSDWNIQDSCKEPKSKVCTKRDTSLQSKYTSRVKALIKTYVEIERKYPK